MKTIIASFILIFCSHAHATSWSSHNDLMNELKGSIKFDHKRVMELRSNFKRPVVNCSAEEFESALAADGRIELVDNVKCVKDFEQPRIQVVCPKVFQPVCGEPSMWNNDIAKRMPEAVTFSNACELEASKAIFLHEGECGAY